MDNAIMQYTNTDLVCTFDSDLFKQWIEYIDAKPKTVETYTRAIKQFSKWTAANGIQRPTRSDVIRYRDSLAEDHKATTVQAYLMAVKLFFQWTAQQGIYPNIAEHIKHEKIDRGFKKDYLTAKQVSKLLSKIDRTTEKGLRDYAIITLMLTTGLRTVSVANADIEDIRPDGDNMALYYLGKGHDDKGTPVYLAAPVEQAINDYLECRKATSGPLFVSESNHNQAERLTTKSISRIVKNALIAAEMNRDTLTAHSLRHTFATQNLLNGGSITDTQQVLGHKNISTTMIYSHILDRAKNQSENRVASALLGV